MYTNTRYSSLLSAVRSMRFDSRSLAAAGVLALGLGLAGAAQAGGPGGSYLQGAYADWGDANDGFNVGGSLAITSGLRAFADYTDTDFKQLRAGGGLVISMSDPVSLEIGGSYQNIEFSGPGSPDDDGFGLHGILRLAASDAFTLSGKVEHVFRDQLNDDLVLGADLDVHLTNQLSLFGSYETYDELDQDLFMIGGRLHF